PPPRVLLSLPTRRSSDLVASFPAPMLFPLVILLFERIGVGLGLGAVALMVLAGQWYILFNVISAVAAIPQQLKDATTVFRLPWLDRKSTRLNSSHEWMSY